MWIVFICSFVAVLLSYYEYTGNAKRGLFWGFVIITVIEAIHYDFGNDYLTHMRLFEEITSMEFNFANIRDKYVFRDPGYALICYLFKPIGFFGMMAVISIVKNYIYYSFIRRYVSPNLYWFAVFILLFNSSLYLLGMSAIRQSFAVTLFVFAYMQFEDKHYIKAILIAVLASAIHHSALYLIPILLLGFIPMKNTKWYAIICGVLFVSLMASNSLASDIFMSLGEYEEFEDYYMTYSSYDSNSSYGLGFVVGLVPFVISLAYLLNSSGDSLQHRIVIMATIGSLIIPFGGVVHLIRRMEIYFGAFHIVAFPIVFSWIPRPKIKTGLFVIFILFELYTYFNFFYDTTWYMKYHEYKTIFSAM